MKIQYVEENTIEAYNPSKVTLNLKNEQNRILRGERFDWDKKIPPNLSDMCVEVLAKNFLQCVANQNILYCDMVRIYEIIPTNLELEKIINLINEEKYWRRRFAEHFPNKFFKKHWGWSWKCVYLEQHISTFCEEAEPQFNEGESITGLLDLCAPYVHTLFINKLKEWDYPRTNLTKTFKEKLDIHLNFLPILQRLPNIRELSICFVPHVIKDKFDFHIFRISPEDSESLINAIMCLPELKILQISRSWINDKCLQKIVQKLTENISLVELNLSYCNIGDDGAKYLVQLMLVHKNLKTLIIKGNNIGPEGCTGFAWAFLHSNLTNIETVDLGSNPIGDEGVHKLLQGLVRSTVPKRMSIAGCNIKRNAFLVGLMLALNTSLCCLDISSNYFDEEATSNLLKAAEVNKRLKELDIRDTNIPKNIQNKIRQILKTHRTPRPRKSNNAKNMRKFSPETANDENIN